MNRKALLAVAVALVLPALASTQTQTKAKAAPSGKTLKVKLNYTGSGVVDEKHRIYVLVCDADPFTAERLEEYSGKPAVKQEAAPSGQTQKVAHILQRRGAITKDATVTFTNLPTSPVYAVAFFDKAGAYDGHADPSPGSPMGLYGSKPGQPDPIKLQASKAIKVDISFDGSNRTP
jgi:hypothetical protein